MRGMSACVRGLILATLVACGVSEDEFVPEYSTLYCDYWLACSDAAMLQFDGVAGAETCLADLGPEVASKGQSCKLKKREARLCLSAMELLTCPAEGTSLTDNLPLACRNVWHKCLGGSTSDEGNEDTG